MIANMRVTGPTTGRGARANPSSSRLLSILVITPSITAPLSAIHPLIVAPAPWSPSIRRKRTGNYEAAKLPVGKRPVVDSQSLRDTNDMSGLHKVTFDPRSGRPIAPLWWRLTTFFLLYAWVMAVAMGLVAWLAFQNGAQSIALECIAFAILLLMLAYWQRRRVKRARAEFDKVVADYERTIARPF